MTKSTLAWGCTALLVFLCFSLVYTNIGDSNSLLSTWNSRGDERPIHPTSSGKQSNDDPRDKADTQSSNEIDTPGQDDGTMTVTGEGIPLVSTGGNGKVVMLTGATGPGQFTGIDDFYVKIIQNRLEYAKTHGIVKAMLLI